MKALSVVVFASFFIITGILNAIKQIEKTSALDEIVRFIALVKTELHYRAADYNSLYEKGKKQGYKHLLFNNGKITTDGSEGKSLETEFTCFINGIGTTDETGQLTHCEEYKQRFSEALSEGRAKQKERLQVNTAVSVLGALTVLLFFL